MRPKLGVSLASHNNPVLLHNAFTQLTSQLRLPDVIAVYINGNEGDYKYIIDKEVKQFEMDGGLVVFEYDGFKVPHPYPHQIPLKMLINKGVELFTKLDHDDLITPYHLHDLEEKIWIDTDNNTFYDFAGNRIANVLEVIPGQRIRYSTSMRWDWNPLGCAFDCTLFNKKAAIAFYKAMIANPHVPDDITMASVLPKLSVKLVEAEPTLTYVSHGKNTSGAIGLNDVFLQQLESKK